MRALVAGALFLKGAVALRQSDDQPMDMDMDDEDGPGGDMMGGPGGDMGGMDGPMDVPEIGSMPLNELEAKLEKIEKMMEVMENKVFPDCKDKPTMETCAMAMDKCIWKPIKKDKKDKKEGKGKDGKDGKGGKDGKEAKGGKGKKSSLVEDEDDEDIPKFGQMMDGVKKGLASAGNWMKDKMMGGSPDPSGPSDPNLDEFEGECVDAPKKEEKESKGKEGKAGKGKEGKEGKAGKK